MTTLIGLVALTGLSTGEKCGGAVARQRRMPWDASFKSTSAMKAKKMMTAKLSTNRILVSMKITLAAIAAKKRGMRLRIVYETRTSVHW